MGNWVVDTVQNNLCLEFDVSGKPSQSAWNTAINNAQKEGRLLQLGTCLSHGFTHSSPTGNTIEINKDGYSVTGGTQVWSK